MFQINYTDGSPRVQVDRLTRVTGGAEILLQTFEDGEIMSSLGLERDEAMAIGQALLDAAGPSAEELKEIHSGKYDVSEAEARTWLK